MSRAKRTKSFSARFSAELVDLLDARSERLGQSKARVAERLIEEGLRTEEFPGIAFRSGPTGRRAGLVGGPDVWEIARDLKAAAGEGATDPIEAVARIAALTAVRWSWQRATTPPTRVTSTTASNWTRRQLSGCDTFLGLRPRDPRREAAAGRDVDADNCAIPVTGERVSSARW